MYGDDGTSMRKTTITIDNPSKPSPADATPSDREYSHFFYGSKYNHNPFTPPILHFSTTSMDDVITQQRYIPAPEEEALNTLTDEVKKQLPDDFRHRRYRRRLLQKHSMESLSPSTQQKLNRRKKKLTPTFDDSLGMDDPAVIFSDAHAYIRLLLRGSDIETLQYDAAKKALRDKELEEAGNTLECKKRLEEATEEHWQLQQIPPSNPNPIDLSDKELDAW